MSVNISDFLNTKLLNKLEFEDYCFNIPILYGFHGKIHLLNYNWKNRFKIIDEIVANKPITKGDSEFDIVVDQIKNSVISSLLLDMHSIYLQLLEEVFGLCFSLTHNKKNTSFWYNFYFCENKAKDIQPNDIYGEVKEITEGTKNMSAFIQKKIDFEFVFLSDEKIFKTEKEWLNIKKLLKKLFLKYAKDLSQREVYNHYKHRNRVITGRIPLKLNSQPIGGAEVLQWFSREGDMIKTNTITADCEEKYRECIKLINVFSTIVQAHLISKHNLSEFKKELADSYSKLLKN